MRYEYELCKGRHTTPATESIFDNEVDVTNVKGLLKTADAVIPEDCTMLVVYVTGLTVAMLSVVQVCLERGIALIAMHYDRQTGEYYRQIVLHPETVSRLKLADTVIAATRPWNESDE